MSDYERLLIEAYKGELLGEATFSAMATRAEYRDHRGTLDVLAQIEARTAATLQPLLRAANVDPGDVEEPRRLGRELAAAGGSWDGFVKALGDALPKFLADFLRLREAAADPHHPALTALVAHEQAIAAFAQLEVGGYHDVSTTVLTRYLETAP